MYLKKLPLALAIVLITSALLVVIITSKIVQPMFVVTNESDEPVWVTINWQDKAKDLGALDPGGELQLNLSDEASAIIIATTADGQAIASSEIYFTQGATVFAEISTTQIKVKYHHQE